MAKKMSKNQIKARRLISKTSRLLQTSKMIFDTIKDPLGASIEKALDYTVRVNDVPKRRGMIKGVEQVLMKNGKWMKRDSKTKRYIKIKKDYQPFKSVKKC
jgi:hypothetical protein